MRGFAFLILAVVVAAIDILVPYLLLKDIASFAASYLFWCIVPLILIVFAAVYTRKWGRGT